MRDLQQILTLPFAWFPPDTVLFEQPVRSLSLCSHQAVKVMGLKVLDPLATWEDPLDEMREVLAYVWLHSAPIDEISRALWSGRWRDQMVYRETSAAATIALLGEWRAFRERVLALLASTEIRIRDKPARTGAAPDDTPPDVISPTLLAVQIAVACEVLSEPRERVCWHVPIWEAWQAYHVDRRREGRWTVAGRDRRVPEETFEEFKVGALTPDDEVDE